MARVDEILRIERLHFTFPGEGGQHVEIFKGLDLTVTRGEFVGVVGRSGCGKSTLLRLIGGLVAPTQGVIRVDDEPVRGPTHRVGIVFQDDRLLPWRTAIRNVEFGIEGKLPRKQTQQRSRELLELVGLKGAETRYPHQLSGGMRQRVNLARALAVDPAILLMDEPFASLDPQTREEQQAALLDICARAGKTVLFVTHQVDEAAFLSDRVIVLGTQARGIIDELPIPFERPRDLSIRSDVTFFRLVDRIGTKLRSTEPKSTSTTGGDQHG